VWHESGLRNIIEPRLLASNDVNSLIFDLCRSESASIVGHFAMVVWCIWNHRNNWVWNGVKDTAKEVAMRAGHMIGEWSAINSLQQINGGSGMNSASRTPVGVGQLALRDSHGNQPLRWQKPRDGWWKCNVDASFSQNPYVVACGWCVRDAAGSVVAVGSNFYNFTATVAEGEALALLEALREAIARGWSNVVFEMTPKLSSMMCTQIYKKIRNGVLLSLLLSCYYIVIQTLRLSLRSGKRTWRLIHKLERHVLGLVACFSIVFLVVLNCLLLMI
jgi:ribonuclease HI